MLALPVTGLMSMVALSDSMVAQEVGLGQEVVLEVPMALEQAEELHMLASGRRNPYLAAAAVVEAVDMWDKAAAEEEEDSLGHKLAPAGPRQSAPHSEVHKQAVGHNPQPAGDRAVALPWGWLEAVQRRGKARRQGRFRREDEVRLVLLQELVEPDDKQGLRHAG